MKQLLPSILLLICAPAWATDRYVCNNATGALAAAVAGADGNAGTASGSPKQTIGAAQAFFNSTSAAGDRVLFCRGGAWTGVDRTWQNTSATAANPITLGAYTPSWASATDSGTTSSVSASTATDSTKSWTTNQWAGYGFEARNPWGALEYLIVASNTATTLTFNRKWVVPPIAATAYTLQAPRPILTASASGTPLAFDVRGSDGGYIVEDLTLQGNGNSGLRGIFFSGSVHDVLTRRLSIHAFSNAGIFCGVQNVRFQLYDSFIVDSAGQGVLWGCNHTLVQGNVFDNNAVGQSGNGFHNFYGTFSNVDDPTGPRDLTFRNNTLTRNSEQGGTCHSPSFVMHGNFDGALIENNLVWQATSTMAGGCFGIAIDGGYGDGEAFRNIQIRGNTIVNLANAAIGVSAAVSPIIENNVIVQEASTAESYGIVSPDQDQIANAGAQTGAKVRNNSFYFAAGTADTTAINFGEYGPTAGSNIVVANNLIYFGSSVNSGHACFNIKGLTIANFTAFNNNLCHHAGGTGSWSNARTRGAAHAKLPAAQAAGFDTDGLSSNPVLLATPTQSNGWSMKVNCSTSPAVGAGHATHKSAQAIKGYKQNGTIGAYQCGGGGNP